MSYDLHVAVARPPEWRPLRDAIALPDLRLVPEEPPGDGWPEGGLHLCREGLSTRATDVELEEGKLRVVIRALATREDCDLALRTVEAAARLAGVDKVEADYFGEIAVADLRGLHPEAWMDEQATSAAETLAALIREGRDPMAMPGPRRWSWIGTRLLGELEAAGPAAEFASRVLATIRRVQWEIPEGYRDAGVFVSSGRNGARETEFAVWLPGENLVIPRVDYVALRASEGEVLMVPFAAVAGLAGDRATLLDECQLLIPASSPEAWSRIIAAARPIVASPKK